MTPPTPRWLRLALDVLVLLWLGFAGWLLLAALATVAP